MDMLLMEMALAEILYLPNIPVKASLNEYIDISKEYSTPNSKIFVNGVLDKVIGELKRGDKIQKTGRGLKES
jgi:N utilization substance protein B